MPRGISISPRRFAVSCVIHGESFLNASGSALRSVTKSSIQTPRRNGIKPEPFNRPPANSANRHEFQKRKVWLSRSSLPFGDRVLDRHFHSRILALIRGQLNRSGQTKHRHGSPLGLMPLKARLPERNKKREGGARFPHEINSRDRGGAHLTIRTHHPLGVVGKAYNFNCPALPFKDHPGF
jgi:hypothetical protein